MCATLSGPPHSSLSLNTDCGLCIIFLNCSSPCFDNPFFTMYFIRPFNASSNSWSVSPQKSAYIFCSVYVSSTKLTPLWNLDSSNSVAMLSTFSSSLLPFVSLYDTSTVSTYLSQAIINISLLSRANNSGSLCPTIETDGIFCYPLFYVSQQETGSVSHLVLHVHYSFLAIR